MRTPPPPLSPYGTLSGSLFQYSTSPSLVAFESCPPSSISSSPPPNKCILIGGLSDGLLPVPWTASLEAACHDRGWSLVQPIISSSYLGFGNGSLERDTKEICLLMHYLSCHRSAETFALIGHSTGCQNSIHFIKHGDNEIVKRTKAIALQAPVSDREHAMLEPNYEENVLYARSLRDDGKGEEMMPRSAFWAPITASRFLSLQDLGGSDDFFSSDLDDDELKQRLSHIGKWGQANNARLLAAFSGQDEYVPSSVNKERLLQRLCGAMNGGSNDGSNIASPLMIEKGNHNLSCGDDSAVFVAAVAKIIDDVFPPQVS